jgi:hypothetical protein
MRIVVDPLDKKSVAAAIKMVTQYKRDFESKEQEFVRRLAEIGVRIASGMFAVADYDGTKDAQVRLEKTKTGYAVIADGSTVGFLEFGTGIRNREWGGDDLDYTPPPHGSYGKHHGKQPYGWWFNPQDGAKAVHTYGNPPAEAMLSARDAMVQRVIQIAREVWR